MPLFDIGKLAEKRRIVVVVGSAFHRIHCAGGSTGDTMSAAPVAGHQQARIAVDIRRIMSRNIEQLPVIVIIQILRGNGKPQGAGSVTGELIPIRVDSLIASAGIGAGHGNFSIGAERNAGLCKGRAATYGEGGSRVLPQGCTLSMG